MDGLELQAVPEEATANRVPTPFIRLLLANVSDLQVASTLATYKPSLTMTFFSQDATNLATSQLQTFGRNRLTSVILVLDAD